MNRTRPLALALLLLATAAVAGQAPAARPTYEGVDAEMALAGNVAAPRLLRALRALSDAEPSAAWEWIARRVRELGLPVSRPSGPARRLSRGSNDGCSIVVEGERHVLKSAWPLSGSASGSGENWPLLPTTASDLAGACAWIPRRAGSPPLSRETLISLAERGAVGALVGYLDPDLESFPGAPLWAIAGENLGPPEIPLISLGPEDTREVAEALGSGKPVIAGLSALVVRSEESPRSVLMRLRGRGEGPLVLVTACWTEDRGGPAATARASGVAALLEVARILQLTIKAGEIELLPFDVLFAIWSHEEGLGEWIAAHPEQAEGLALCIHLERLGPGRPGGTLYLDHFGSSPEERSVTRACTILNSYSERKGFWPRLEILSEDAPAEMIPWRRRPLPHAPCLTLSTAPADPPWARSTGAAQGTGPVPGFGPQLLTGWDHPDHLDSSALAFGLEAGTRAALALIARFATEGLE